VDLGELRARLLEDLEPRLALEHVELVDVKIHPRGRQHVVCLLIEPYAVARDGAREPLAVTVDDCARVSRLVEGLIDEQITWSYVLEVSSPGTDRPLRTPEHYRRFVGERVVIRTTTPVGPSSRKQFTGVLDGFAEGLVSVRLDDGECVRLPLDHILQARVQMDPWKRQMGRRAEARKR
jgi:ribosome maturation factor RimP